MYNPVATYRLQFHQQFTFGAFAQIITYLQQLGVSTIYASPVFEAETGSTHGYDGVNPHRINLEIGTEQELRQLSTRLKAQNIGWLQDIVPNHMGYSQHNPWLTDVLEKGPRSAYGGFFDSARTSQLFTDDRLMVPFLGSALEQVIQGGELTVVYQDNRLLFKYYDNAWPVNAEGYKRILGSIKNAELQQLLQSVSISPAQTTTFSGNWNEFRLGLQRFASDKKGTDAINRALKSFNNNPELLTELAALQYYRLCSYEETDQHINFRRFFTVNSLICLNVQNKAVFEEVHRYIKQLTDEGIFQGLRIDHIDGLYDPEQYLKRLRRLAGNDTYIVTEKILEQCEDMPRSWLIQGNTGYDFLAQVNNLFTNRAAERAFTRYYEQLVQNDTPADEQLLQKKAYILTEHMGGELDNLCNLFYRLKLADKKALAQTSSGQLKQAIAQVLINCPVYRFYGNSMPLPAAEEQNLKHLLHKAAQADEGLAQAFGILTDVLLHKPQHARKEYNKRALQFYQRLMQFSGPLMAKGVEDTLMYTYNRFIGHNEVGDTPQAFGSGKKAFHSLMESRQKHWPLSINDTSTHDTKRGEDVRARLNVLTDLPSLWLQNVQHWQQLNAELKQDTAPDANDEYFIYQTLTGVYAMPGQDEDDIAARLPEYLTKALREAKTNTSWAAPDETYEQATLSFAAALLNKDSEFWASFSQFQQQIADYGIINSLAQVLLKFTCPGVPDVYQGCELWDLNLVDPDNRRPVDYTLRQQLLQDLNKSKTGGLELVQQLWDNRYSGQIKLWLTQLLFQQRQAAGAVFAQGHYVPLKVKGAYAKHLMAFARRYHAVWYVIIVPLHLAEMAVEQGTSPVTIDWKDTIIEFPAEAPEGWKNLLLSSSGNISSNRLEANTVLQTLPMALLQLQQPENNRSAGLLMHISSLPSAYGIGDMGPEARQFSRFLSRGGQRIWQVLPLNPVSADQQYSPYSSPCSMAGNIWLISPDDLADAGLLTQSELKAAELPLTDKADFEKVIAAKTALFEQAYQGFLQQADTAMQQQLEEFCNREAYWLDDYALYTILRQQQNNPWYRWPDELKLRKPAAMKRVMRANQPEINKIKWLQFEFIQQWHRLKENCHSYNIRLFGDLPFYVSYDSSDVWANRALFDLDKEGNLTGVAGVPPDYFNTDGQLWGMPVYNWSKLKSAGYQWWINRLRKNMELFDLLRLDHFRAFEAYWEVPATETTARNGQWKAGPGSAFFNAAKAALGELPFVAEDLGDVDEKVFALRDEFAMPGMKVLQFAFGDDMPSSLYIPHNYKPHYVVYTGTHDNNTTAGWYRRDADKKTRKQLEQYAGQKVSAKNIYKVLARMAYASAAETAILPFQDVLGLDEQARMNNPATTENNWQWRYTGKQFDKKDAGKLLKSAKLYNRL